MKYQIAAAFALLVLTGCVTLHRPMISGALPKNAEVVGVGSGESSASYLFWWRIDGDESVQEAMSNAMQGTAANDMTNLVIERKTTWALFYRQVETKVHGALVKYTKE